jgi:membrane protease subunit HflC
MDSARRGAVDRRDGGLVIAEATNMPKNVPTIMVAALIIMIILLMMCAFQVRFTETVVVTRFDKVRKVIEPNEAGLHWKLPWPIDRVHRYDARLRAFDTDFRQLGTKDQKTIVLTAYGTWRIADAEKFLEAIGREDAAARKIRDLLENQVSTVLRTYPLDNLVNTTPELMKIPEIEEKFLAGVVGPAEDNYGIEVVSVGIKRLGLPESVSKEVFVRMKEDRQKEIKELKAQGEAQAKQIRANAEEKAQRILARAQAYAKAVEGQGDAQAARYYEAFAKNRELSDFLKKLETVQRIFEAGQITLVLDAGKIAPFGLLRDAQQSYSPPPAADQGADAAGIGPETPDAADDEAVAVGEPDSAGEG